MGSKQQSQHMKFRIIIIFYILILSCSSVEKSDKQRQSFIVLKVEDFKTFYRLRSIDAKLGDTVNIISLKDRSNFNIPHASTIKENNKYGFTLQRIRTTCMAF